jgi:CRISPR/Cas system CSM-associated protein Csm5 (group 7 of RAMP superfamily)
MASEVKGIIVSNDLMKDVVIRTLRSRVEEINQKLSDIYESMRYFERKYGMNTEEFYKEFVDGELGDDMDFFEWKASAEIYGELKEEKRVLIGAIG